MCLSEMGFNACNPQSEQLLDPSLVEELKIRFDKVCILYDNDTPGQKAAIKNVRAYNIKNIVLPDPKYKDVSDWCCIKSLTEIKEYINAQVNN